MGPESAGELAREVVDVQRVELTEFEAGQGIVIQLEDGSSLSVGIIDPESGLAVVKLNAQSPRRVGYRDTVAIVGTRPYQEGAVKRVDQKSEADVKGVEWGVVNFGEELVVKGQEVDKILFTGQPVECIVA